jgi:DNA-binding NarL/FixJ family response regulator
MTTEPLAPTSVTQVLVCEDDDRLRAQLVRLVSAAPGLAVCGDVGSAEAAEEAVQALHPDLLLLDLELPGISGIELIPRLAPPPAGPEVLILTSFASADQVFEAIRRGAAGYLVKGAPQRQLLQAIAEVLAGGVVIEPRLARRFWNLVEAHRGGGGRQDLGLSDAEVEVLNLVARGLTNPEVGHALGTTRRSVKALLESIYRKLGVAGRVEAVLKASGAGLIQL